MYITYLDLPSIPQELLESVDEILNKPFSQGTAFDRDPDFRLKDVPNDTANYIKSIFDMDINIRYQLINRDLPLHVDKVDRRIAFNYLLDPGGENVLTNVFDNDMNLTDSIKIETHKWHRLQTSMPHLVKNIQTTRIAISVGVPNYNEQLLFSFVEKWRKAEESNPIRR